MNKFWAIGSRLEGLAKDLRYYANPDEIENWNLEVMEETIKKIKDLAESLYETYKRELCKHEICSIFEKEYKLED
ncbi:MAG: hypothetical protein ACTSQJ_00425 [Promethearchaeota archaeon]